MKNNKWLNLFSEGGNQRDEYQLKEMKALLANIALVLWSSDMLLLTVLIIIDTVKNQLSIATVWLFVVNFSLSVYFYLTMRKRGVSVTEFETTAELKAYKKKARQRAFGQATLITGIVFIVTSLILPLILGEPFSFGWLDLFKLIGIGVVFTSGWLYLLAILNIKKYEENE